MRIWRTRSAPTNRFYFPVDLGPLIMTTAHRPTWKAAVGRSEEGGWSAGGSNSTKRSALDAPAHTKLKFRSVGENKEEALKKSLEALEQAAVSANDILKKHRRPLDPAVEERAQHRLLKQTAEVDEVKLKEKYNDSDVDDGGDEDDESDLDDSVDLDSSDGSDEDDEDDEGALQAELAKIRAERKQASRIAEEHVEAEETSKLQEAALLGNPLLNETALAGRMKRRWNDDVVFRNQAKSEPAPKKRFINDTVRNDFHKRFLNKFIR
jgi:protein CWC15